MNESELNNLPEDSQPHPAGNRPPEAAFGTPGTPGATLRRAREERGWTVEQVASQLYLAPRQVAAIEADDYAALPGTAVTRGFMRSYAKLLKLDPAPLLTSLGGETAPGQESLPARKTLSTPFSETSKLSMNDRPAVSSKWVLIGLLVVLAGVGLWAAQQNGQVASMSKSATDQVRDGLSHLSGPDAQKTAPAPAADTPGVKTQELPPPGQAPAPDAATGSAAEPAKPELELSKAPEINTPLNNATPSPAAPAPASPAAASPAATPASPAAATPVPADPVAGAKGPLVITVHEETWVEVKRADNGKTVFSKLVKAGESETIEIASAVNVVIGNATGATVTLRGEPVDLKRGKGNVARLSLK